MYRVVALLLCAYCLDAQSPQEILKNAVAAQQSGHLDEAIRGYRLLLKTYPNIAELRSNLGAALAAEGNYSEAITEYQRSLAIKANPQVLFNLGLAHYKASDLTNAVEVLKKVRAQEPSNLQVVTVLADCYLRLGRNKDVIDLLTALQQADPNNAAFNYMLGTALVRNGDIGKGQIIIDKILRNGNSAEAQLLMGTTKYMASDFAGARTDFEKAIALNPNLPDVYSYYGLALLATGDQAGARSAFQKELRFNPNNFDSNLRMGVLFRQDDQNDEALKYLKHALQIRPGDPGVRYQIAAMEVSENKLPEAQRDLESLIRDSPDFLEAHVSLATVYFREKRKDDGNRERQIVAKLNAQRQRKTEVAAQASQ